MRYVSGSMLTENGFVRGYLGFEDGLIVEAGEGKIDSPVAKGIIVPTFVNSHTHVADFIVPANLALSLEETVAPPNGLKHRVLAQTSPDIISNSMEALASYMLRRGTSRFIDFREGGAQGARLLSVLSGDGAVPVIFGRPRNLAFDKEEVDGILDITDGIGVSSVSDWDYGTLSDLAAHVRKRGRRLALHASEKAREDIDAILDLRPSFIVHMTSATADDLESCCRENVPVVVCPRSNMFFGRLPPLVDMVNSGVTVALGTDNAMFSMPDMLTELEFAGRILRLQGMSKVDAAIDMAFRNGRKILNGIGAIGMEPESPCDFMVIGSKKGDAATDLVLRSGADDPIMVCVGNRVLEGIR